MEFICMVQDNSCPIEFMQTSEGIKEINTCLAVPVPGHASWMNGKLNRNAVLLKSPQEFKVNSCLKVKGELEELDVDSQSAGIVQALDMLDSLYTEWSGIPIFHVHEYTHVIQSDLLPKDLKYDFKDSRKLLLDGLVNVLSGDEIAAEYLMMHLLSKIEGRTLEQISGYFPLNLCNISSDKVSKIKEFLSNVLPFATDIKFDLDNLNNVYQFLPEMVNGALKPGTLQVCDSTSIILDETAMKTGTLQERGLVNLSNLKTVLQTASLPFVLGPETSMEMPIDIKFLVLSEGKTLLPVDCVLPVQPNQDQEFNMDKESLTEDLKVDWDELRGFLNKASNFKYSVPEDVAERIVSEFSSKSSGRQLNGQDLIRRLETARLLSKSMGNATLDYSVWQRSVELDQIRMDRLDSIKASKVNSSETLLR